MPESPQSRRRSVAVALLRAQRHAKRLRQADLAQLVGRTQSFISNVERGARTLDLVELLELLDALEVNAAEFIENLEQQYRILGLQSRRNQQLERQRSIV